MRTACTLIVAMALASMCRAGANATLPTGVRAVWDLDDAYHEVTPTRDRVCINGLWRWQPASADAAAVPTSDWGYAKVPGSWPRSHGDFTWVDTQAYYPAPAWKDADLRKTDVAWYQRGFTVPQAWNGRRITLSMDYVYTVAVVFIDGEKVGEIDFPAGELDLTKAVHPNTRQVLSVLAFAKPLGEQVTRFSAAGAGFVEKATVDLRTLCGDVFLSATPVGARLADPAVETSVRKSEISVHAALENLKPDAAYRLRAQILEGDKAIKEWTGEPFKYSSVANGRAAISTSWKPEKLWDLNTPGNVYQLRLSLLDETGKVVDALPAVRFGFRELWIEGRDLFLNGTRIHYFALPLDSAGVSTLAASYAGARETFRRLKLGGVNLVYMHNYDCLPGNTLSFEEILRAADDSGMLVSFTMPHVNDYEWKKNEASAVSAYTRHAAFYVSVARNHPSVVMYAMNHNFAGYNDELNPDHMDGRRNVNGDVGERDDYDARMALRAEKIVSAIDSTRVIYHHSGGNIGQMYTVNIYLNHTPAQERDDWFAHWATEGVKPMFLCEYGTPSDLDWTTFRGWFRGQRYFWNGEITYEACFPEWGAQYRGDKAYDTTEKEKRMLRYEAEAWRRGKPWMRWDYPINIPSHRLDIPNIVDVLAMYIPDNWRAFRTWGVTGFNTWEWNRLWTLRDGLQTQRKNLPVDWAHLQRPGYSPDFSEKQFEQFEYGYETADWKPTAAAEALLRNNQPVLAYLGGNAEHFTEKGHNFLAGQTVEKQVIAINESRQPVRFQCEWVWKLPNPVAGHSTFTVETGEQKRIPIRYELAADLPLGTYSIDLTVRPDQGPLQKDTLEFSVLAPPPAVHAPAKVAVFDKAGETAELFRKDGVPFTPVDASADLSGYDLLVIGKGALTVDGPGPDLRRVRDGLKVIVFEQTAAVLERRLGFHVEEYGLRRLFPRVGNHPALAGVSPENLTDWRGQATLLPPQLQFAFDKWKAPTVEWAGLPVTRAWRVGSVGNVASVLIEKPGRGDFLPIVDGGFSLQYAPLLEYREGAGVIVFCQLDVTGRTTADPAADRIRRNLLNYVADWKPQPRRNVAYLGEAAGKAFLEHAGFLPVDAQPDHLPENAVLVVGPGGGAKLAHSAGAVKQWLDAGGKMVAVGLEQSEAAFLPFQVASRENEYSTAAFEPPAMGSMLVGVGPADLDSRDMREIPLITAGAHLFGKGVLAESDVGNVAFCQLVPWQFDYAKQYNLKRTYRRASFAVGRLLSNGGASSSTPLLSRFSEAVHDEKAHPRFQEGLYLDQPEEWDDPYRYFCW